MEINVTVKFRYWSGKTLATHPERLSIIAKFKDPNRFNKFRYTKTTTSIAYNSEKYDSYEDYLDHVEQVIGDIDEIKEAVENMVKKYFDDEYKSKAENKRLERIWEKTNKINKEKIQIKVKIDE